jgi:nucleoside-diphosphate-sugar epimerase
MAILLTGATGKLGKSLLPRLLAKGFKVRAIVRPQSSASLPSGVMRAECDLSLGSPPASAYFGVDRVIHLAALVGEYPEKELKLQNETATRNLLDACPDACKRLVLASSISVYGSYPGELVSEACKPCPDTLYGKSKLAQERASASFCGKFPVSALRFGMIYGPNFTEGYYDVFERLSCGKMALIGDGKNRVPLIHSDDACRAILYALSSRQPGFRAYNIVGELATQEELLRLAAEALGAKPPVRKAPLLLAKAALALRWAAGKKGLTADHLRQLSSDRAYSPALAEKELGFGAKVKLGVGIKAMARAFLAQNGRGQAYGKG